MPVAGAALCRAVLCLADLVSCRAVLCLADLVSCRAVLCLADLVSCRGGGGGGGRWPVLCLAGAVPCLAVWCWYLAGWPVPVAVASPSARPQAGSGSVFGADRWPTSCRASATSEISSLWITFLRVGA